MVDFILLAFFVGTFAAGCWAGATFGTVKAAGVRIKAIVKGWFA